MCNYKLLPVSFFLAHIKHSFIVGLIARAYRPNAGDTRSRNWYQSSCTRNLQSTCVGQSGSLPVFFWCKFLERMSPAKDYVSYALQAGAGL